VAGVTVAAVLGWISAVVAVVLALVVMALYVIVLGVSPQSLEHAPLPRRWTTWLGSAVVEEEQELADAIRPPRGTPQDAVVAGASLVVVVVASVAMERAASSLGTRYGVPEIVIGALVLAAVTSLPNAVAAVYLAARGRGAAVLSIAFNSNALNVTLGLLLPATVIGLGGTSGDTTLIVWWYLGLTVFALAFAYRDRGLRRDTGAFIIAIYLVFVVSLLATA
jgi:cation:H+ antiporter